jgi:hypothetical protein
MLTIITMANAQVNVDFLENGRGGHYLLHVGFKFSVRTSRNNGVTGNGSLVTAWQQL